MSGIAIYFFFVLPVLIAAGGFLALYLHERSMKADMERDAARRPAGGAAAQANANVVYPDSLHQAASKIPAE